MIRNSSRRGGMPRRIVPAPDAKRQCQTSTPTRTGPGPWCSTAPEPTFNSRRLRSAVATRACEPTAPAVRVFVVDPAKERSAREADRCEELGAWRRGRKPARHPQGSELSPRKPHPGLGGSRSGDGVRIARRVTALATLKDLSAGLSFFPTRFACMAFHAHAMVTCSCLCRSVNYRDRAYAD
jgi:hypothetical protein